jgi:transcriptional regulator with XRE-family HTH domain
MTPFWSANGGARHYFFLSAFAEHRQTTIAQALGVSQSTVSAWLNGVQNPTVEHLASFASTAIGERPPLGERWVTTLLFPQVLARDPRIDSLREKAVHRASALGFKNARQWMPAGSAFEDLIVDAIAELAAQRAAESFAKRLILKAVMAESLPPAALASVESSFHRQQFVDPKDRASALLRQESGGSAWEDVRLSEIFGAKEIPFRYLADALRQGLRLKDGGVSSEVEASPYAAE